MTNDTPARFDPADAEVRCEWGLHGVEALAPTADAVVLVDVLSFSTAVTVAVGRGAAVYPYRWKDDSRVAFAEEKRALLAGPRGQGTYSLSPLSLEALRRGSRIVLPSPNGATLSLATGDAPTFAGCLRNAGAVAAAAARCGRRVAVIPCGERWPDDGSLRPALEDWVGAGAVVDALPGRRSAEAEAAATAFRASREALATVLAGCASGRELVAARYEGDVAFAAALDADAVAPRLRDGAYVAEP